MESDLSDDGKRKRDEQEGEVFKKSKKLNRSPPNTNEGMLKEMMKLMRELSADIKEIKLEQQTQGEETKALKEDLKEIKREQREYMEEINKLKDLNKKAMIEINDLKGELKTNGERIERLEKETRRKNIIVQGLSIDTRNGNLLKDEMKKFIEEEMGIKPIIKAAHRLGPKTIVVALGSEDEKLEVMHNKSKLRNRPGNKVFIEDDLTKEEREIQKLIRQKAKEERNKGKQVKIGFSKLVMDGQTWKWSRTENKLRKVESITHIPKN